MVIFLDTFPCLIYRNVPSNTPFSAFSFANRIGLPSCLHRRCRQTLSLRSTAYSHFVYTGPTDLPESGSCSSFRFSSFLHHNPDLCILISSPLPYLDLLMHFETRSHIPSLHISLQIQSFHICFQKFIFFPHDIPDYEPVSQMQTYIFIHTGLMSIPVHHLAFPLIQKLLSCVLFRYVSCIFLRISMSFRFFISLSGSFSSYGSI